MGLQARIWASRLGFSLEAGIWVMRLGFGSGDWDLGLKLKGGGRLDGGERENSPYVRKHRSSTSSGPLPNYKMEAEAEAEAVEAALKSTASTSLVHVDEKRRLVNV